MLPDRYKAQRRYTMKQQFLKKLLSTRDGIVKLQKHIAEATRKLAKQTGRTIKKVTGRKGLRKSRTN